MAADLLEQMRRETGRLGTLKGYAEPMVCYFVPAREHRIVTRNTRLRPKS